MKTTRWVRSLQAAFGTRSQVRARRLFPTVVLLRRSHSWTGLVLATLLAVSFVSTRGQAGAQEFPSSRPTESKTKASSVRVLKNLVMISHESGDVLADVYLPKREQPAPMVMMIHGGGWLSGDKWNLSDHSRQLAEAGFVAVSINYRLAPKHPYPSALEDCQASMKWLEEHAAEWNGDLERLGIWGYSAGAQLAAMLATQPPPAVRPIRCCVLGGMPSDLTTIPEQSSVLRPVFGATRAENPQIYHDASPLFFLHPKVPPCFLFHGENDMLVSPDLSDQFHQRLQELNVPSQLMKIQGQGHLVTFFHPEARKAAIAFLTEQLKP